MRRLDVDMRVSAAQNSVLAASPAVVMELPCLTQPFWTSKASEWSSGSSAWPAAVRLHGLAGAGAWACQAVRFINSVDGVSRSGPGPGWRQFVEWLLLDYVDAASGPPCRHNFWRPDNDLADWEVASLQQWADSAPPLRDREASDSRLLLRDVATASTWWCRRGCDQRLKWSLTWRATAVDGVYTVGAVALRPGGCGLPRRMLDTSTAA